MKTSCPACGAAFSLDALLGNEGAREAVMAALAIPAPLGKLLVQYLALFRPARRQLSFDRVSGLLGELLPPIEAARIERGGRTWSAPQDYWKQALEDMLAKRDKLTLPLKNHGYLLAIIEGYSSKAEARQEAEREDRRAGRTPVGGQIPSPPAPLPQAGEGGRRPGEGKRSIMPESVKQALKPKAGGNDDHNI